MALNPVVFFRKYQKLWMAGILLMCMLSFVLCTGGGNDLGQWLMNLFNFRSKGAVAVRIDDVDYHTAHLHDLKQLRNLANDYMRKMCERIKELALEKNKKLKNDKNSDQNAVNIKIKRNADISKLMEERLKGGRRYFPGGVKLDDLVDFKLWLLEADRLKIQLDANSIMELLIYEFLPNMTAGVEYPPALFRDMADVVRGSANVPRKLVWQGLVAEFRVRMAQLALATSQPELIFPGDLKNVPEDEKQRRYFHSRHHVYKYPFHGERLALSPAQLRDYYNEMRLSFDLVMVPVEVDDFKETIKSPSDDELRAFFDLYKGKPYNPTSDEPGFEVPEKVKVAWVTANTEMPYYKMMGKFMAALETGVYAPAPSPGSDKVPDWAIVLPQYNPMLGVLNVVPFAAAPAVEYQYYDKIGYSKFQQTRLTDEYLDASDLRNNSLANILAFQGQRSPAAVASFIGALAQPEGGIAAPAALLNVAGKENEVENKALARSEPGRHTRRLAKSLPTFIAPLVALGDPLTMAAAYREKMSEPDPLVYFERMPLSLIPEARKTHEKEWAATFVRRMMQKARELLMDPSIQGKVGDGTGGVPGAVRFRLPELLPSVSYQYKLTEKFYDRYSIKLADELKPLRDAYEDKNWGYIKLNLVEGMTLKDSDFDKLFFDKRSFSCAGGPYPDPDQPPGPIAPGTTHLVRQWPPIVSPKSTDDAHDRKEVSDFFTASGSPFLFWIAAGKAAYAPKQLANGADLDRERAKFLEQLGSDHKKELDEIAVKFKGKQAEAAAAEDVLLKRYLSTPAFEGYLAKRQLRDRVVQAWKVQQTREKKVIPAVRAIALEMAKKTPEAPRTLAKNEARKLRPDRTSIELPRIAPLMPKASDFGPVIYTKEYSFPKDTVLYPRDDMGQKLLVFAKPKSPVAIGYKELDELNAELLTKYTTSIDNGLQNIRVVQVFTNKPRDRFYIATLVAEPRASSADFFEVYKMVGEDRTLKDGKLVGQDTFLLQAFDSLALEAQQNLIKQIRKNRNVKVADDADVRKMFDTEN